MLISSAFINGLGFFGFVIVAILVLLLMVTIHELGHYIAGRILKFKIVEFAVGFGPKLWSRKNKRGEIVSLRAFPLGGFCAFYGEESAEKKVIDPFDNSPAVEDADKQNYFTAQAPWKRIIVFMAGGVFNILSAFIFSLIFILAVGYAVPEVDTVYNTGSVEQGIVMENPNANIIKAGDIIVAVNGVQIDNINTYHKLTQGQTVETISYTVERMVNGQKQILVLDNFSRVTYLVDNADGTTSEGEGIGIGLVGVTRRASFFTALWQMFPVTWDFGMTVFRSLGGIFTGAVKLNDLSGPVGTIGVMASLSQTNFSYFFILLPLIAVNLGIFNLLPIPALDGSKIVFAVIEWIRKKPVNQEIETMIHFVGLIALLFFVVFIDVFNLFTR